MKRGSDTEEDARSFSRQEMERRHMRIREGMQLRGLACLVAVDNDIIRYIAGAAKHATPHKPGDVTGVLIFPLLGEPVLSRCHLLSRSTTPERKPGARNGCGL